MSKKFFFFNFLKIFRSDFEKTKSIKHVEKDWTSPWILIELWVKQILSRTGVKLQHNDTIIISFALKLFLILLILFKKQAISNFSEYKINVPKITEKIPAYCMLLSFSFKKINEKIELKRGEKDRRGIVRLKSDSLIDFKNIRAEITPKSTKVIPGIE